MFRNLFRWILDVRAVVFAALVSPIASIAMMKSLTGTFSFSNQTSTDIFILFSNAILLFTLIVFYTELRFHQKRIDKNRLLTVQVWQDQSNVGQLKRGAYEDCISAVQQARESIYILGPHFTTETEDEPGVESHDDYLSRGIIQALESHATAVGSRANSFRFLRVIQLDTGKTAASVSGEGSMLADAIANDAEREAIKQVLRLKHTDRNDKIDARVVSRDYVPSLPSIMVIDDERIYFSLPSYSSSSKNGDEAYPARTLRYDFVLGIHDKTKIVPAAFSKLIRQMGEYGTSREVKGLR